MRRDDAPPQASPPATRLRAPRRAPWFIARPHLVASLKTSTTCRATSICAPAGYGKSALLAEWTDAGADADHVAWLRLDPSDNIDDRFVASLVSALAAGGAVASDLATATGRRLASLSDTSLIDILGELLNALADSRRRVVLVLDNAHVLDHPRILRALNYLLEFAPDPLHLVMSQQAEPALRLSRARLAGELTTIGAEELAFTQDETTRVLESRRVTLDRDRTSALQAATGGWPAGVVAATFWLARPGNTADALLPALTSGAITADYVRTEVIARLPAEHRRSLYRLAVVDELNGQLAAVLTDGDTHHERLSELGRTTLSPVPGAPTGTWYRWHPTIGAVLRQELVRREPERVAELHRRAASWYADNGLFAAAIRHGRLGGDQRFLAELITERWLELTGAELRTEVAAALATIPNGIRSDYPELSITAAAAHVADGSLAAALPLTEETLARLERVPAPRRPVVAAMAAGIRLYCAELGTSSPEARSAVLAALRGPAFDGVRPAAAVAGRRFLSLALTVSDTNAGPSASLTEVHRLMGDPRSVGAFPSTPDLQARLSALSCSVGALTSASQQAREAVADSNAHGREHGHAAAVATLTLAWVDFLRGDPGAARERADRALEILADRDAVQHCLGLRLSSLLSLDQRLLVEARAILYQAYVLRSTTSASAQADAALLAAEADLLLAEGDYPQALRIVQDTQRPADTNAYRPMVVIAADAHLRMGNPHAALQVLTPWLERGGAGPIARISVHAIVAAAQLALGRPRSAIASLAEAVRIAAPEGIVRPLLDHRDQLGEALTELATSQLPESRLLNRLLPADTDPGLTARPAAGWLPQPLTPREHDVLRHLRSRLPLVEIAAILGLSPNTVKTHVKHIYEKLQATDRRDAIQRATDLNLL